MTRTARIPLGFLTLLALLLLAPGLRAQTGQPPAPPPLPTASQPVAQFYYDNGGQPAGPVTLADIQARIAAGALNPDTLVWKAGLANWVPATQIPEIAAALDAQLATFLLGTWETDATDTDKSGVKKGTLIATAGGGLSGSLEMASGDTLPFEGSWSAHATAAKRLDWALNLKIKVPDQSEPKSVNETAHLEIVDNDTLRDLEDNSITKRVRK